MELLFFVSCDTIGHTTIGIASNKFEFPASKFLCAKFRLLLFSLLFPLLLDGLFHRHFVLVLDFYAQYP